MRSSAEEAIGGGITAQSCYFILTGPSTVTCQNVVDLHFEKDRYIPFTSVSGSFLSDGDFISFYEITCCVNGKTIHKGPLDRLERKRTGGRWKYKFSSKGYTAMLGQNEPVPRMNYNVNLASLAEMNKTIPNVVYQGGTLTVNYVYVKEKSTIWDAITAYGYKAYSIFPYIYQTNTVRVTPVSEKQISYNDAPIVSCGKLTDRRKLISEAYMADADGNYTHSYKNASASSVNIVRTKYYALDRQWLSSPVTGLTAKVKYSQRAGNQVFLTYIGFNGEELYDKASLTSGVCAFGTYSIGRVEINIREMRILTTVTCYPDGNT